MYFRVDRGKAKKNYVAWIDLMGTKNIMTVSPDRAANYIMRLHGFSISAKQRATGDLSIELYPMNDGVFVVVNDRETLKALLRCMFEDLAKNFLDSPNKHRFLVRGAIAYGDIYTHDTLKNGLDRRYSDGVEGKFLVGLPLIQAFQAEKYAPPFGLYVHESARGKLHYVWHEWWGKDGEQIACSLFNKLKEYFEWAEKRSHRIPYPVEKINQHRAMAEEYFGFTIS